MPRPVITSLHGMSRIRPSPTIPPYTGDAETCPEDGSSQT